MRKLFQTVLALLAAASVTGCASTGGYFIDRGRDAADVFTATVGAGVGAKARVGPLRAGLFLNHDAFGIRGGTVVISDNPFEMLEADLCLLYVEVCEFTNLEARCKNYCAHQLFSTEGRSAFIPSPYGGIPFTSVPYDPRTEDTPPSRFCHFYTQIEVAGGLIGTVRLGFNVGELVDFLLGWTTIDIFRDDLEPKKPIKTPMRDRADTTAGQSKEPIASEAGGSTATTNNVKQIVSRTHHPSISPLAKAIALRLWGKDGAQMLAKYRIEPPIGRYETVMGPRRVTSASDQFVTDIRVDHVTSNYWLIRSGGIGGVYQESGPFTLEGDGTNQMEHADSNKQVGTSANGQYSATNWPGLRLRGRIPGTPPAKAGDIVVIERNGIRYRWRVMSVEENRLEYKRLDAVPITNRQDVPTPVAPTGP